MFLWIFYLLPFVHSVCYSLHFLSVLLVTFSFLWGTNGSFCFTSKFSLLNDHQWRRTSCSKEKVFGKHNHEHARVVHASPFTYLAVNKICNKNLNTNLQLLKSGYEWTFMVFSLFLDHFQKFVVLILIVVSTLIVLNFSTFKFSCWSVTLAAYCLVASRV